MYDIIIVFRYTTTTVNVYVIAAHINLGGGSTYQLPVYAQIFSRCSALCDFLFSRTPQHKCLDVKICYGRFYISLVANINGFSETHNIPSVPPARVHCRVLEQCTSQWFYYYYFSPWAEQNTVGRLLHGHSGHIAQYSSSRKYCFSVVI